MRPDIGRRAHQLLLLLQEGADHPMALVRRLAARGESLTPAGIYAHIAKLHDCGLVAFYWDDGLLQKGGRSRKVYFLTEEGNRVLREKIAA